MKMMHFISRARGILLGCVGPGERKGVEKEGGVRRGTGRRMRGEREGRERGEGERKAQTHGVIWPILYLTSLAISTTAVLCNKHTSALRSLGPQLFAFSFVAQFTQISQLAAFARGLRLLELL